jgi:hypothetical protein
MFLRHVGIISHGVRTQDTQHYTFAAVRTSNLIFQYVILIIISNIAAEWLVLLLRIQKVPGSNFGPEADYADPETGYANLSFSWFSSVPPAKCYISTLSHDRFLPYPFQFSIQKSFYHLTQKANSLSFWQRRKINSINKQIDKLLRCCVVLLILKAACSMGQLTGGNGQVYLERALLCAEDGVRGLTGRANVEARLI